MMRLIRNSKAFTLVEVLIVVAILGLLAAIAVPNLMKARTKTAVETCAISQKAVARAIVAWAAAEKKTISEMQTAFPSAGADVTTSAVVTDGYLDVDEAKCPLDRTAYTAVVDANGKPTVSCTNTAH